MPPWKVKHLHFIMFGFASSNLFFRDVSCWKLSYCSHSSDAFNYPNSVLLCLKKAPIHHMLNYSIQLITGLHGDVLMWTVALDNDSLPVFGSARGQTQWTARLAVKMFVRRTTLRLASCSFRALSSSLLARTASSVFFLLSRLTFSSVSGALLFR